MDSRIYTSAAETAERQTCIIAKPAHEQAARVNEQTAALYRRQASRLTNGAQPGR